jgi:hypothetical protein
MARLDFLWQLQARDEKLDMEALQGSNRYDKYENLSQTGKYLII